MTMPLLLPIATLLAGALVSYLCARVLPRPKFTGFVSLLFLIASGVQLSMLYPGSVLLTWSIGGAQTYLQANSLAIFLGLVAVGLGALVSIFSVSYMEKSEGLGRYYALLLIMIAGIV